MEPDIELARKIDIKSSEYYFNRELSFIEFNKRVLAEAENGKHPLMERLKFVTIFSSNLDEFFMIRVAGLKRQIAAGVVDLSMDGMTPSEQLEKIRAILLPLYERQEQILNKELLPEMEREGIVLHQISELNGKEKKFVEKYFAECVLPVLTPLSLDPAHPFPRIRNMGLNIAFLLKDGDHNDEELKISFLQIPQSLDRFVKLHDRKGHHFVLIENIIKEYSGTLFPGLKVSATNTFRVTRDADIEIADDEAEDLLKEIAEQIKNRKWGTAAVRLEVSEKMPQYLLDYLMRTLEIERRDVFIHNRPLKLPDFMDLANLDIRHLKDIPFQTRILPELLNESTSIFQIIKKHDLMVHHPFDSFTNSVLRFIDEAADDPNVLAIKITLYRTGMNSPVVDALKRAASKGKDVTAFVELKARFDEENNILWAHELENAGAHVVYGVLGLKTHCKIAMVVRKEKNSLKTYLHFSTGNYNHPTSRIYTDIGIFTSKKDFESDAINLFNFLTGYSHYKDWQNLLVAPGILRKRLIKFIEREAEKHSEENPGLIVAKINSLAHGEVSQALYKASQKGVQIKLLIRGICCLRPGVPGVSENIEVRSILGRFLEHSRIFYFKNGGDEEYYISSADWMTRNLHKRVELVIPVRDAILKRQLAEILDIYWRDNTKSWRLNSDGSYEQLVPQEDEKALSAQQYFLERNKKSIRKHRRKSIILP